MEKRKYFHCLLKVLAFVILSTCVAHRKYFCFLDERILCHKCLIQKVKEYSVKSCFYVIIPTSEGVYSDSSIRLMTTSAEISRLAASGITRLFLLSMTSSVTISHRRGAHELDQQRMLHALSARSPRTDCHR